MHIKLIVVLLVLINCLNRCYCEDVKILHFANTVSSWGETLGQELRELAETVTRKNKVIESFKQGKVIAENAHGIANDITKELNVMMKEKEQAVRRIVEAAEKLSLNRKKPIFTSSSFDYYNADSILNTTSDPVVDRQLLYDMRAREEQFRCEEPFKSEGDQYFSSNIRKANDNHCKNIPYFEYKKDYFTHLPLVYHPQFRVPVNLNFSVVKVATSIYEREDDILNDVRWSEALDLVFKYNFKNDPTLTWQFFAGTTGFLRHYPAIQWSNEKYDQTFDFRTRAWYLEAISSPKDVVILLDMSGSMWQFKWKTAKLLVNYILDTLGDNDYVNVYLFNNETRPLVDCFNYTLMQAHEENLRLLRESLDKHTPYSTGDMSAAFRLAFATLAQFRKLTQNGAPVHCNQIVMLISEGIDYDYNAAELFNTYNRIESYYTPVRVFTFLIGTVESDAAQMEWIACANMGYYVNISKSPEIAEKVLKYLLVLSRPLNLNDRKPNPIWTSTYVDLADRRLTNWLWNKHEGNQQRQIFVDYTREAFEKYNCLMDNKDHFLLQTEHEYSKYLKKIKYAYTTTVALPVYDRRPGDVSVLGVAGIDVTTEYMKMMTMPHRIGVNGYAFILTNNGLLLLHPDHRTEFEGIIKPTFNRVDMTEVEIVDDNNEPRDFNKDLLEMRDKIVKQETGHAVFKVKTHMDDMRRVILNTRHYFYTKIGPFSLVVAMPDRYGFNRIIYNGGRIEENVHNLSGLDRTHNWKIHPEWRYCKHYGEKKMYFKNPENELKYFLNRLKQTNWKWNKFCNQGLVKLFILDAKVTEWYEDNDTHIITDKVNNYNVKIVFMATHTGLTRWKSYIYNDTEPNFIKTNNKAIDEIWYKRSIEYNYNAPRSFVYSVPSIIKNLSETLITATSGVFAETKGLRAPAAVVGFQFEHSILNSMVTELAKPCNSSDLSCFLLDNNAYILVSKEDEDIGRFFGSIRPKIMYLLVEDGIYHRTRIFDYQSICYKDPPKPKSRSPGHRITPFFTNIFEIISWIFTSIMCFFGSALGAGVTKHNPCFRAITSEYDKRAIRKTLPTPCDREFWLYTLKQTKFIGRNTEKRNTAADCTWNYIIRPVTYSNLVLLVVNEKCLESTAPYNFVSEPVELLYNNLSMPCYIATKNNYTRRRYIACINKHENESTLNPKSRKYCGVTW